MDYNSTKQEAGAIDTEISELEAAIVNVSSMSVSSILVSACTLLNNSKYQGVEESSAVDRLSRRKLPM